MSELAPQDLSAEDARDKVELVKALVADAWEEVIALYRGRAWIALGYESWDALCDGEFEGARIRLPREDRREIVGSLREAGLSTRAIGSALGIDHSTVVRDLPATGADAPVAQVTGLNGKTYAPTGGGMRRLSLTPKQEEELRDSALVLDEFINSDRDVQVARYRQEFARALAKADDLLTFPAEEVAERCDSELIESVQRLHRQIGDYLDRLNRARSGLRVIEGGSR